jgi:hypothetical protein
VQELEHHAGVLCLLSLRIDVRSRMCLDIFDRQQAVALHEVLLLGFVACWSLIIRSV